MPTCQVGISGRFQLPVKPNGKKTYSCKAVFVLLFQRKAPGTAACIVADLRIAADTFTGDTGINHFGKFRILNKSNWTARMKRHLFPRTRGLYSAFQNTICQRTAFQNNFIPVEICVKSQGKRAG